MIRARTLDPAALQGLCQDVPANDKTAAGLLSSLLLKAQAALMAWADGSKQLKETALARCGASPR
jgi:hypothetical protein